MSTSTFVMLCVRNSAAYKDPDGKCSLAVFAYHLIGEDKDILACDYRALDGTCSLGKEKMTQGEIDQLVKMVLDDKERSGID